VPARLQAKAGINGATILDDCYNASPASMLAALSVLAESPGRRMALLGDMLELGSAEAEGHQAVGQEAAKVVDGLFTVGPRGALIAAAVDAGAVAGEATGPRRAALADYGRALGLAFQIADDILDATAPTAVTGKRVGGDAEHGKATYPAVLGLEGARGAARELLARCLAATDALGPPAEPLRAIATFVVERAC
jgi:hypothetical protein